MKQPRTLNRKNYWAYRGKCRNCDKTTDWLVDREGMTHQEFKRTIDYRVPQFMEQCENCNALAVFDFIAMTGYP